MSLGLEKAFLQFGLAHWYLCLLLFGIKV